jgi:hypothetical protein
MSSDAPSTARRRAVLAITTAGCVVLARSVPASEQRFPDVVAVKVRPSGPDTFDFDVTVSSPYDTPRRYADGFRVKTLGGEVLGERKLLHDHQDEQPFTRDLYSVKIPRAVKKVVIEARDRKHGYGGRVAEVALPGR